MKSQPIYDRSFWYRKDTYDKNHNEELKSEAMERKRRIQAYRNNFK